MIVLNPTPMSVTEPITAPLKLDDIRHAIDGVDDGLLDLLLKRALLVDEVKSAKSNDANSWATPLRPAREMQILKRMVERSRGKLPPDLLVRLWRSIICAASLKQSPITIHVSKKLSQTMGHRLRIRDYFGPFPVEECRDEAQALVQVNANPADICIVETESGWLEPFMQGHGGKAQVIGVLPMVKEEPMPRLLVLGVAPSQSTGEDETLLITKGNLPRDFDMLPEWQVRMGSYRLTSLAGYFSEHESPLISLIRSNPGLGLKVAGRYASPIEV